MKAPQLAIRSSLSSVTPRVAATASHTQARTQARWLHKTRGPPVIPSPVPIVPDVPTLLKVLGRGLGQYADKFPSWEALFTLTSPQLKEIGIEPPRTRRYLLNWLERYRRGELGPGGDFRHVQNGEAILKVASTEGKDKKWVVNVPGTAEGELQQDALGHVSASNISTPNVAGERTASKLKGYSVRGADTIVGPYALPLKAGEGVRVPIVEGMWEHKQGQKVDGGERRRAEVRWKRRIATRRAEREAAMGR